MKYNKRGVESNYKKLIVANCINRFGDSIDSIALTWLVYAVTGSAFWSAVYYACNQLPSVLIQPFAGAIVENQSKKRVMVFTDVMRGIAVGILVIIYQFDAIHPLVAIIFTLFVSTVEAFRVPAGNAFVAILVTDDQYENAISKNTSFTTISSLLGTGVAGVIIALLGTTVAIIVDALTFFLSSVLLASIKIEEVKGVNRTSITFVEQFEHYKTMFIDGLQYAKESVEITGLILLVLIFNGILAPINSLIAPLISGYYALGSRTFSMFSIALSLGMAIAGFTFIPLADKVKSPKKMLGIGALLLGAIYFLLVFIKCLTVDKCFLFVALFLVGCIIGYIVSANTTMLTVDFMRKVAKTHIARIAALYNSMASASIPVLAFILGIATEFILVAEIFMFSSIFCLVTGCVMFLKKDRLYKMDKKSPVLH